MSGELSRVELAGSDGPQTFDVERQMALRSRRHVFVLIGGRKRATDKPIKVERHSLSADRRARRNPPVRINWARIGFIALCLTFWIAAGSWIWVHLR